MSSESPFKPRVVLYGIGHVGKALAKIADMKGWPIVAAYNRAGEKIGKDLGRVCGLERDLGVIIEDGDTADYSALKADVALVAVKDHLELNFPIYQRMMSAGINVLCNGTESYHPRFCNAEVAAKIDALAKQNGVTFTGSGIWDTSRFWAGILATGPCVKIDSLIHTSATDMGRHGERYFEMVGIGMTPDEFQEKVANAKGGAYSLFALPSIVVLEKLGYTIEGYKIEKVPVLKDQPFYCKAVDKTFPAGITLGGRLCVDVTTKEGVTARSEIESRLFEPGEVEEMRWRINGTPSTEIRFIREDSALLVGSSLFNRIPDVMAAQPGIAELSTLGPEISIAAL